MDFPTFAQRVCPNSVVLIIAILLGYASFVVIFPALIMRSDYPILFSLSALICVFTFVMFVWCWVAAATMDPGRIKDDLRRRGLLNRIQRGDIPECLRNLPLCAKCGLPKPKGAEHCDECGACCLRYDHHCGVIGQCIGDKNLKAFIISFFYATIFGFISCFCGIYYSIKFIENINSSLASIWILIAAIYDGVIAIIVFGFGTGMVSDSLHNMAFSEFRFQKFIQSFGNTVIERFIPTQKDTTFLAWPGVSWDLDYEL